MEKDKILKADLLDIIFEGRNKDYGAYDLRKTYSTRMMTALAGTSMFLLLISGTYLLAQPGTDSSQTIAAIPDLKPVELTQDPPPPPLPPPPPAPPPAPPQVQTIKLLVPIIVAEDVRPED